MSSNRHRPPQILPPSRAPLLLERPSAASLLALEDRLLTQTREIDVLLMDNQALAATHVALKQEVVTCHHQLRLAALDAARIKADRNAELEEVYQRAVKAEAEARAVEAMRAELAQVRGDVGRMAAARDEMVERLQRMRGEMARARADRGQAAALAAEIEVMQKEVHKGRAAVEYEKKAHADNIEQSQIMEQNMVKMAREVEKLRAELANAEKRARAAAAAAAAANPGYAGSYGNPEMSYDANSYAAAYNMHQVQPASNSGAQYGVAVPAPVPPVPYGYQQSHAPR